MAKSKKKRNKKYTGVDSAVATTKVTRVSVPKRSTLGKWWHENRKKVAQRLAIIGVVLILYAIISWLIGWIF